MAPLVLSELRAQRMLFRRSLLPPTQDLGASSPANAAEAERYMKNNFRTNDKGGAATGRPLLGVLRFRCAVMNLRLSQFTFSYIVKHTCVAGKNS